MKNVLLFGLVVLMLFVAGCTQQHETGISKQSNQSRPMPNTSFNYTYVPKPTLICPTSCDDNNSSTVDWCGTNSSHKCVHDALQNRTTIGLNETNGTIKIANWNLQIFGDSKESNSTLMTIYAKIIRQYDIIFVQEIRDADQSAFPKLCGLLPEYNCNVSSRAGRTQSKEQVGVIYRKGIMILTWSDFNPDPQNRWERPPIAVEFSINGYNVTAYNIHVDPDSVASELDSLEQVVSDSGNVMILADLNADCSYYNPQKADDFDGWNWIINDSDDTTVSSTNCAYDRIILNQDAYEEFVSRGVYTRDIDNSVSDHYLVWTEIKTNETTPDEEVNTTKIAANSSTNTTQETTNSAIDPTICDVVYDPPGKEPDEEMIQICNPGSVAINIGGWIISDGEGSYTIPRGTTIQGGATWRVFGATYNPTGNKKGLYLANSGDCVMLLDNHHGEIDRKCW